MDSEKEGFYVAYTDYSRTLRTWLVAYGVGGPVLFLSSEKVLAVVARSGQAGSVSGLFLFGVAIQVGLAVLNKAAMWACYYGKLEPAFCSRRRYKACVWFADQFWIDIAIDVGSVVCFAVGTWWAIHILSVV